MPDGRPTMPDKTANGVRKKPTMSCEMVYSFSQDIVFYIGNSMFCSYPVPNKPV